MLSYISSAKRGDNKGHVLRFHLRQQAASFDFSQPQAYLVQLELHGPNMDTANVRLNDRSDIIQHIDYYKLKNGVGIDLFLKSNDTFYQAAAYPDGSSQDLLIGLTKTDAKTLAAQIKKMKLFAWSHAPRSSNPLLAADDNQDETAIDTTYQKIKNNIKFDTVVLDPGHGGTDVGAIGYHHTYEKNVVLNIAKKVGGYINKYLPDVNVVYTRDDDHLVGKQENPDISIMQSLVKRGQIANRAKGDLFVSIHCNSARAHQAHGTETWFLGLERSQTALDVMKRENQIVGPADNIEDKLSQEQLIVYELANSGYIANSEKLATMVQHQFKNRAQRKSRGVKQARFVVLYHASMPAILIETGFITNPTEQKFLTSDYGQSIIASAIFRAIRNYKENFEKSQHLNGE